MRFKVSTNIKSIIGKDLISDKYVAIFELVKNSCDAGAKLVSIEFIKKEGISKIIISDNGKGMSTDDLQNKWLFIAYSEKKHLGKSQKKYAGSKGIGRFSCDRLGKTLLLYTKKADSNLADKLIINWDQFEQNDMQKVEDIDLLHEKINRMPNNNTCGTILEICDLREGWERDDLLKLRAALMKLVSPEKILSPDNTEIEIIALHELGKDNEEQKIGIKGISLGEARGFGKLTVNGIITNDIFEKIGIKTTSINVILSEDGETIETCIEDRGEFIYKIVRKNSVYDKLKNIQVKVFYLNRSAKMNFTKTMGVEPVNYGSIFVYRNGFRIYPYGSSGSDFFGINERKSQGYNRFLGTRELMGRVEINGENDKFIEKTSRDGGFIENFATLQFQDFFLAEVIRSLEKYVVDGIEWGDPERDSFVEGENEQGLMPIDVSDRIIQQFANLTKKGEIIDAEINPKILQKVNPEQDVIQKSIKKLEIIANSTESNEIYELVSRIKEESEQIKKDKQEAEKNVDIISEQLRKKKFELNVRERQISSLQRKIKIDPGQFEDALHVIYSISESCVKGLNNIYKSISDEMPQITEKLANIIATNKRIYKISDLAINYDYGLSIKKPKDIVEFIKQYIKDFWAQKTNVYVVTPKSYNLICNFDVSKLSLIIDNLIDNSKKHKAKNIEIIIERKNQNVSIIFKDDGTGLDKSVSNAESIFEKGFSTTFGLGLGLYHVRRIINNMAGEIIMDKNVKKGFALEVLFNYECKF